MTTGKILKCGFFCHITVPCINESAIGAEEEASAGTARTS